MPLSEVKFLLFLWYIRLQGKNFQKTQGEKWEAEDEGLEIRSRVKCSVNAVIKAS